MQGPRPASGLVQRGFLDPADGFLEQLPAPGYAFTHSRVCLPAFEKWQSSRLLEFLKINKYITCTLRKSLLFSSPLWVKLPMWNVVNKRLCDYFCLLLSACVTNCKLILAYNQADVTHTELWTETLLFYLYFFALATWQRKEGFGRGQTLLWTFAQIHCKSFSQATGEFMCYVNMVQLTEFLFFWCVVSLSLFFSPVTSSIFTWSFLSSW